MFGEETNPIGRECRLLPADVAARLLLELLLLLQFVVDEAFEEDTGIPDILDRRRRRGRSDDIDGRRLGDGTPDDEPAILDIAPEKLERRRLDDEFRHDEDVIGISLLLLSLLPVQFSIDDGGGGDVP